MNSLFSNSFSVFFFYFFVIIKHNTNALDFNSTERIAWHLCSPDMMTSRKLRSSMETNERATQYHGMLLLWCIAFITHFSYILINFFYALWLICFRLRKIFKKQEKKEQTTARNKYFLWCGFAVKRLTFVWTLWCGRARCWNWKEFLSVYLSFFCCVLSVFVNIDFFLAEFKSKSLCFEVTFVAEIKV